MGREDREWKKEHEKGDGSRRKGELGEERGS